MIRVVGCDPSLTALGLATPEGPRTLTTRLRGPVRLAWLRDEVLTALDLHDDPTAWTALAAVEGYSYDSGHAAHQLGELGGVLRLAFWERRIPYVVIPPSTLKQYATGRGNAGKEEVLAAAIRRLGYQGHDHNQADALWLRAMAMDHYGHPLCAIPATQRAALHQLVTKKGPRKGQPVIDWPALAETVDVGGRL
jgi:Holliday junction resolvasome RuvABC endonuclease subunit